LNHHSGAGHWFDFPRSGFKKFEYSSRKMVSIHFSANSFLISGMIISGGRVNSNFLQFIPQVLNVHARAGPNSRKNECNFFGGTVVGNNPLGMPS